MLTDAVTIVHNNVLCQNSLHT